MVMRAVTQKSLRVLRIFPSLERPVLSVSEVLRLIWAAKGLGFSKETEGNVPRKCVFHLE